MHGSRGSVGGGFVGIIGLSVVLSASVFSNVFAEQVGGEVRLRGSNGLVRTSNSTAEPVLRGSAFSQNTVVDRDELAIEDQASPSFLSDMGSALFYLRDNIVPVALFRGSTDAVSDRNVTYTMPARGVLRYSMMHNTNLYEGLRGRSAGVGDTVATALRGSYSARARLERANVDRARIHGALANFLPKVTATIDASISSPSSSSSSTGPGGRIVGGGIEVAMPIYTSGVNLNTYRQAQHISRASDYSYLAEEHRVALEAITAHVNLRLNRKIENTLRQNTRAMQRIASIARKLFAAGEASKTDIAIADANVESARAEQDLARKTREETQSDYESVTGKHAPARLQLPNYKQYIPRSLEDAVDMAMRYNPTIAASLHAAVAGKHAARAERGRYGPQINLYGNYNRDLYHSTPSSGGDEWRIGVRLKVPLFDMTIAPNVNAARHEALESGYRALDQGRLVERQIERQWTAYHSATRRTKIIQRQVNALRISVKGARREFQAGFRSITDVLTDQIKLARAQITLESVRHEKMLAAYELAFTTANPRLRDLVKIREVAVSR
ncbi:MAG: TolC family protein [Rhizobiaceae bacterium]